MTHITPFAYCSSCGTRYPDDGGWPRACANCGRVTYRNPLPIAVVIVPIGPAGEGVLLVRRAVAPHIGQLALPGGYVNYGETWQAAGAREVAEETGVLLDPATIRAMDVLSAPDSTILIFGVAQPLSAAQLPPFQPNDEASERLVVERPMPLAFPLHTAALEEYFRRMAGRAGAAPAPGS